MLRMKNAMLLAVIFFAVVLSATGEKVAITKCCHSFYTVLSDSCEDEYEMEESSYADWTPTVYSYLENRTMAVDTNDLHLTFDLAQCPDGYIARAITDFRFYDDGSLTSASGKLESGEFCLDQMNPLGGVPQFVARFCMVDPCNATNCVRKCCPHGMIVNGDIKICQFHPLELALVIQNENGLEVNDSDVLILDGARAPICDNGRFLIRPEVDPEDEFFVLPSGQLKIPAFEHNESFIQEYCIDRFLFDNITERVGMICMPEQPEDSWNMLIYPYFLIVSSVFLLITFLVYAILPEIRNIHGVTIMSQVASLAVMYISLGLIQLHVGGYDDPVSYRICIVLGVIAHFSWLSSFTWLNVMSFDIWWTFSDLKPKSSRNRGRRHRLGLRFVVYSIYAWGVPTLIVLIGQILDNFDLPNNIIKPNFGKPRCWFEDDARSLMAYLYGPVAVIIFSNIVFFVLTAIQLYRVSVDAALATNNSHAKQNFRVMFSIFILMGVSWMMEIISFVVGGISKEYIWIPTDIINILTGIFIFVIFVCKRNVWKLLAQKWVVFDRIDQRFERSSTMNRRGTTSTAVPSKSQPLVTDSIKMKSMRSNQIDSADEQPDLRLTSDFN